MKRLSFYAFLVSATLIVLSVVAYYPKWEKPATEATLSWDVSGYYLYLPAVFIYHDITNLTWWGTIEQKYQPGPGMGQAFKHPGGHFVMKYPMGQALQFLPWFTVAHLLAGPLGFEPDGFSKPYQVGIGLGSLIIALLGLWLLRRIMLQYFSDQVTALVLICMGIGSNYLEYAGITGAMTHNWLFTLNCLLILASIRFHQTPTYATAAVIGLLVGWATITRPTELVSVVIPLLWGVGSLSQLKVRMSLFRKEWLKLTLAGVVAAAIIFLQPLYWKYATGEWIVYSYEEQGFTWFPPHIEDVLWSAKAGWLVYSPIMAFAIIGLFLLRKQLPAVFPSVAIYCLTALYITSAWDIWWYGGSLGQRAIVQAYPLWAFGLGAFWIWASQIPLRKLIFGGVALVCIYLNIWWCHQAHLGGQFHAEQMTRQYILTVLGKWQKNTDDLKYLDTRDRFTGNRRQDVKILVTENYEQDTSAATTSESPIEGTRSARLTPQQAFTPGIRLPNPGLPYQWVRASATFKCEAKEWEIWAMTQFTVRFKLGDQIVKDRIIRLQRHIEGSEVKTIDFDTRIPDKPFDQMEVFLWNPGSAKAVWVDNLQVEVFH